MREYLKFYINGAWVDPVTPKTLAVINPATEAAAGHISLGSAADVDLAVRAARAAFASYSQTSVEERAALLERIIAEYKLRYNDGRARRARAKSAGRDGHGPSADRARRAAPL